MVSLGKREMIKSKAVIKTQSGSKYLQQLSKHWAHKIPALTFDKKRAHIPFNEDVVLELEADEETLTAQVSAPDLETVTRYRKVFVNHIVRFAFRETLDISWQG